MISISDVVIGDADFRFTCVLHWVHSHISSHQFVEDDEVGGLCGVEENLSAFLEAVEIVAIDTVGYVYFFESSLSASD